MSFDYERPVWISGGQLILNAQAVLLFMKYRPGEKMEVLDTDQNQIVEVYPETIKIPYLTRYNWRDHGNQAKAPEKRPYSFIREPDIFNASRVLYGKEE